MKCMRNECTAEATRTFIFEARPFGYRGDPIIGEISVNVCKTHATEEDGEELMRGVLPMVQQQCRDLGKQVPEEYRFHWHMLQ